MQLKRKEKISSWILLSVFLPMVLLSSLHVHYEQNAVDTTCEQCECHVQHTGHLTVEKASVDDCVLCRFLGQDFVTAMGVVMMLMLSLVVVQSIFISSSHCQKCVTGIYRRGPPLL